MVVSGVVTQDSVDEFYLKMNDINEITKRLSSDKKRNKHTNEQKKRHLTGKSLPNDDIEDMITVT